MSSGWPAENRLMKSSRERSCRNRLSPRASIRSIRSDRLDSPARAARGIASNAQLVMLICSFGSSSVISPPAARIEKLSKAAPALIPPAT
eukprot:4781015-Pleurochrysis_carterae.AAC.1